MKLIGYVGNRVDARVELDVATLAHEYIESDMDERYAGWPLDRKLRLWLASDRVNPDDEKAEIQGKNVAFVFEPADPEEIANRKAYDELVDLILTLRYTSGKDGIGERIGATGTPDKVDL